MLNFFENIFWKINEIQKELALVEKNLDSTIKKQLIKEEKLIEKLKNNKSGFPNKNIQPVTCGFDK